MLNVAEVELARACQRLGVSREDLVTWNDDYSFFVGANGEQIKEKDDVLLTRSVPVSEGARWKGGDAQPGCVATVIMFSTANRGVVYLECYSEPDGFAFGWEKTSAVKLYKTTEEKWPR